MRLSEIQWAGSLAVLGLLALLGGGCQNPQSATKETSLSSAIFAPDTARIIEPLTLSPVHITNDMKAPEKETTCHVDYSYLQIDAASAMPESSASLRLAINKKIAAAAIPPYDKPTTAAAVFLEPCTLQISNLQERMPVASFWSSELTTTVGQNNWGVLSLLYTNFSDTGGVHPNTLQEAVTYDISTGEELTLFDLLAQSGHITVATQLANRLLERASEISNEQSLRDFLANPTEVVADQILTEKNDFWLTPTNLGFFYNPYSIASRASGTIVVEIPRSDLGDALLLPLPPQKATAVEEYTNDNTGIK